MAKIVLSMDGVVLQEMVLSKERITIGRRPHNDLVINNSAISAEHAVVVTMLHDAYLEDLNSTNGTRVNGQPITKHFLKNNDIIELAKYTIRFVSEDELQDDGAVLLKAAYKTEGKHNLNSLNTAMPRRVYRDGDTVVLASSFAQKNAVIKILNGHDVGKEIELTKALTTIGLTNLQVAIVTQRGQTYSLTHMEGTAYPRVNGNSIGSGAYAIASGDVIEVAEIKMIFLQK